MNIEKQLLSRSTICELCGSEDHLVASEVAPSDGSVDQHILTCSTCKEQMENPDKMDVNHWRSLNDSMWSTVPAVQVIAWRMLNRLKAEGWPQDLLDMLYLDEDILNWAQATGEGEDEEDKVKHIDSNGVELQPGDNVVLIKDLKVSGVSFTAKRGTAVRRISLVADDPTHIEGKVEGQQIVILTKWVKKI